MSSRARLEAEVYDRFSLELDLGLDVVNRESYEIIIDSRRKDLLRNWLLNKRGVLLDFGCGDGTFSRFVKNKLELEVVGTDISAGMIEYAKKNGKKINYLIADCHNIPIKRSSLDFIIGFGIFHHLHLKRAINECMNVLRKNGTMIVYEPNYFCPLSYVGRKLFKTRIHTPNEKPLLPQSFVSELSNEFKIHNVFFLSPVGFIFPFLWASKFQKTLVFLKRYANIIKIIDQTLEKIPFIRFISWQFVVIAIKRARVSE